MHVYSGVFRGGKMSRTAFRFVMNVTVQYLSFSFYACAATRISIRAINTCKRPTCRGACVNIIRVFIHVCLNQYKIANDNIYINTYIHEWEWTDVSRYCVSFGDSRSHKLRMKKLAYFKSIHFLNYNVSFQHHYFLHSQHRFFSSTIISSADKILWGIGPSVYFNHVNCALDDREQVARCRMHRNASLIVHYRSHIRWVSRNCWNVRI